MPTKLEYIGMVFIASTLFSIGKFLYNILYTYTIGPAMCKVDFAAAGKWAIVTGCTDGIGKQYAKELAARGCDIVLISRSLDKLKKTAEDIEKRYNVATMVIQADFSNGDEIYSKIEQELSGLEIGTLVNNVGVSYHYPEYYLDIPDWENMISTLIKANIVSVTRMTKLVLPDMVKREKGIIINIGSASSIIPSPLLTVYAASKAYVDKFSEGIDMEYSKKGITVQCVLPGFVCSNMSGFRRNTLFIPSAEDFVQSALSLVGVTSKTTGYFPHAVFTDIMTGLHSISETFTVWLVTKSMESSRRKILKKYKKQ